MNPTFRRGFPPILLVLGVFHCAQGSPAAGGTGGQAAATTSADGSTTGFLAQGTATQATTTGGTPECGSAGCITEEDQKPCDSGLEMASSDGMDGARAIGLCQVSQAGSWGVVSATFSTSHGQPLLGPLALGTGIMPWFGPLSPREGSTMLALSSGSARLPNQQGYYGPGKWGGFTKSIAAHGYPSGFEPQESPACPDVEVGDPIDSAMLELKLKTPSNAKSLTFDFNFYTFEFPNYICSRYNDQFVALLHPAPAGAIKGNIAFDAMHNFISVNAGFLRVCSPRTASNGAFFPCPLGYSDLVGTGFDDWMYSDNGGEPPPELANPSASTSWLNTVAPIENPGHEITLRFAIWDSGDTQLDSTTLIDNFRFSFVPGETGTTPIPK